MEPTESRINRILNDLLRLHAEIDRSVNAIRRLLMDHLKCGLGCVDCCQDDLTVFEAEALRIRSEYSELLKNEKPAAKGRCAFLSANGACRVYPARPYVCRTQGLPLRWFDDGPDGEPAEYRDICPINENHVALMDLPDHYCFTLGEFEERLRELQTKLDGGKMQRVLLRNLFEG
jgi:uncharacterized protein